MEFLFPLASIISETTAKTVDKVNYTKNHITANHLMRSVFAGMSLSLLAFVLATGKPVPDFNWIALGLLALIAFISFAGNYLDYLSLKHDDVSLREPLWSFEPILAGLVGYALFPEDRKEIMIPAFLLGIFIVYYGTHRRHLGSLQKKGMTYLLIAVILHSFLPSIYSFVLQYVAPEYITLFRVLVVLLLTWLFMPVKCRRKTVRKTAYGLASGVLYAAASVAGLYAIAHLGVAQTMLLMMLGPSLVYLVSYLVLREKVRTGEIVSSICLVAIVGIATAW